MPPLVTTPDGWGIGRVVEADGDVSRVSFFRDIVTREIRTYKSKELKRARLSPQVRVYLKDRDERWRVGRVKKLFLTPSGEIEYAVQLPNDEIVDVSEADLEVRCLRPLTDPTEVIVHGGGESQFLHDRRYRFLDAAIRLRAASRGMTGATSAAIELVSHQLRVVRRILSDPIQRYLLADEVGMGKTIEAGIVMRQCLLDDPESTVLVLAPPHLVEQWCAELKLRFGIGEFPGRVRIARHEDAPALAREVPTLLVVDEAHRMLSGADLDQAVHDSAKRLASAQRLLLLSATPAIGHEEQLLDLLRVLDPGVYGAENLAVFRQKVEQRGRYGNFLRGLRSDAADFLIKQRAKEASGLFPEDGFVQNLAAQLLDALAGGPREDLCRIIDQMRTHIAETYRIHHRLIRTRRLDAEGWEFQPRGPQMVEGTPLDLSHVRIEVEDDDRIPDLLQLLEQWRIEAVAADLPDDLPLVKRWIFLFEALGQGVETFAKSLRLLLGDAGVVFEGECRLLEAMAEVAGRTAQGTERVDLLATIIQRLRHRAAGRGPKVVVFISGEDEAIHLVHTLGDRTDVPVFLVGRGAARGAEAFRTHTGACILVCDRSGEEGQNLHFADVIIHADLPFSADRIEQRIGRLDRFGRRAGAIRHRVVVPNDDDESLWQAWFETLTEVLEVFNRPLADVQFMLSDLFGRMATTFFRGGASGLRASHDEIRGLLREERARLDDQYALDRVASREDEAVSLRDDMEEAEEDEAGLRAAFDDWVVEALRFQRRAEGVGGTFSLAWSRSTLIPEHPWKQTFAGLNQPVTFRRSISANHPEVSLLRPGHPLFVSLLRFMDWEDRGTAFATWRVDPTLPPGLIGPYWLGFRICYRIEADLAAVADRLPAEAMHAMNRWADDLLPPCLAMLHLDAAMRPVDNAILLEALQRPYANEADRQGRIDINLTNRPQLLAQVIDSQQVADLCREMRRQSEQFLKGDPEYAQMLTDAAGRASREIALRRARIERRLQALTREGRDDTSLRREAELAELVLEAVRRPSIRVDAVGLFVLSAHCPPRA